MKCIEHTAGAFYRPNRAVQSNASRTVTVNSALTLQAIFIENEPDEEPQQERTFKLKLTSNNPAWGMVKIGDGTAAASVEQDVLSGSSVQISAVSTSSGRFTGWCDGNTEGTRTVTVTENMEFQADFTPVF